MSQPLLQIAGRKIGPNHPAFVIAEAGVNHNGSLPMALALVDAAADAHADAVKFQTFSTERLVSPAARKADYQTETTGEGGSQFDMLKSLELSVEDHRTLQTHAAKRGLMFLSTPFDESSADLLCELDLPALKVSSGDVTNHPFLAHLARTGRPVLLSTGMSHLHEVVEALEILRAAGGRKIGLFHCVSDYPAAAGDLNLRAMQTLRDLEAGPVGFSDHTLGQHLTLMAVALGATMIEKHLTLDKSLPGPDHRASLNPTEFFDLIAGIRDVEAALGDGVKRPRGPESENISVGRKSLHWRRDLPAGAEVASGDLIALRPAVGLPPGQLGTVTGRKTARPVTAGMPAQDTDFAA